jgi:UDP-N-acetylmuramyl pentapeptide phosphotransferase/UDP-N-acetylglucosamine-1-phosphate transferase
VRRAVNYALMYALSPVGTLLNTGLLVVTLLVWGTDPHQLVFWAIVIGFVVFSGWLDLRAYVARKRHGFSAYQASAAVTDAIWGPPRRKPEDEEEAA